MGINTIGKFAGICAVILNKEGRFTAHSFRRSAATSLVGSGISVVGLYHTERWKFLVTVQEYQEFSNFEKENYVDRLDMTDGKKDEGLPAKKRSAVIMVVEWKWKCVIPFCMAPILLSTLVVRVVEAFRS